MTGLQCLIVSAIGALFCGIVAERKNLSIASWVIGGAMFPLITVIAVLLHERELTARELFEKFSSSPPG